ncbi:MAG: CoA-binding protein [Candidatus Cloacimonadota bacterium]|nr:MAG: CoA-binding protein [Candidatus Cloacimonadota bacterium]
MTPTEVLERYNTYAVVGATQNKEKFGYKIFKTLQDYGKKPFPVNPRYDRINEDTCFLSISELPEKPEVVVAVVPPRATDKLIEECKDEGINIIWLQPGTYNDATLQKCNEAGIEAIYDVCIMVELKEM